MSATNIRALKRWHVGEDVYVVASGASLNYVPAAFFAGRVVVAVNEMFRHVPATFALLHHHEHVQEAIDAGQRVVTSDVDLGGPGWGTPAAFSGEYFTYKAALYEMSLTPSIDVEALAEDTRDRLVTSACTTSEALQFAAHLGASTIICCGLDGAALDGDYCVKGYNGGAQTNPQHIRLTQPIIQATIDIIRNKGVNVFSLSPFVGADHEGHRFTPPPVLTGHHLVRALQTVNWQAKQERIVREHIGSELHCLPESVSWGPV